MNLEDFERTKRLGSLARNLLADETFLDIVKGLKEDAIFGWTNGKSPDEREASWRDMQAVARLQAKLKTLADNYTKAVHDAETQKQKQVRLDRQREERG